jgi:homoserine kinase type II
MARMHLAVADFPRSRANNLSLAGWQGLFQSCRERADEVQAGLAKTLEREVEHLGQHWPEAGGGAPQGVIHADLFPDNVFFLDGKLSGIIDFYFACNDAFAYDLAISLNAWCFEPDGAFNITKARALFQAYGTLRPLNADELRLLPLFARGAALRFLLTRLYDWLNQVPGAMVKPKDPREYLKKLNFHRRIKDASAYGLDKAP